MRNLRESWKRGQPAWGGWCQIPSTWSAEVMGRAGFDYVTVDMQHGLIGYADMVGMVQAIHAAGTPAIVRVPWNQPDHIMKALDAGAQGVIIPMVNSAEEAQAAVRACRYPPDGYRSWGPIRASLGVSGYSPHTANRRVVVAVMIRTPPRLAAAGQVPGVAGGDAGHAGPPDPPRTPALPPPGDSRADRQPPPLR